MILDEEFSQMEMAVLRSAGIEPRGITYAGYTHKAISIFIRSFEAIYRKTLDTLPDVPDIHSQAHNAAVLVDAIKSNLLVIYPELRIVSVNALLNKESRVLNVILSTLFQEGQRIWLEKLKKAHLGLRNEVGDSEDDRPAAIEQNQGPQLEAVVSIDKEEYSDLDEYSEDDSKDSGIEELRVVRGSMLDRKQRSRRRKPQRRSKSIKNSPKRGRNYIEENARLVSVRQKKLPIISFEQGSRSRPGSAPSTRGARKEENMFESKDTPRKKERLPRKNEYGEDVIYTYDTKSGRRLMLTKDELGQLARRQRSEKLGDVRNMSDFDRQQVEAQVEKRLRAQAPTTTRPSWPGHSTEKSTRDWVDKMRKRTGQGTDIPSPKATVSMFPAYQQMEALDMFITVEHCSHCEHHTVTTRHKEEDYKGNADLILAALVDVIATSHAVLRLGVSRFSDISPASSSIDKNSRIGAFEIQLAFRLPSGVVKVELLHSKLTSLKWPSKSVIVKRVQTLLGQLGLKIYAVGLSKGGEGVSGSELHISSYESTDTNVGINAGLKHIQWVFDARDRSPVNPPSSSTAQSAAPPNIPTAVKTQTNGARKPVSPRAAVPRVKPVESVTEDSPYELNADELEADHPAIEVVSSLREPSVEQALSPIEIAESSEPEEVLAAGPSHEAEEEHEVTETLTTLKLSASKSNEESKESMEYFDIQLTISAIELVGHALTDSDFDEICCRLLVGEHTLATPSSSTEEARSDKRLFLLESHHLQLTAAELETGSALLSVFPDSYSDEPMISTRTSLHEFMHDFGIPFEISVPLAHTAGAILAVFKCSTAEASSTVKEKVRRLSRGELLNMKFEKLVSFNKMDSSDSTDETNAGMDALQKTHPEESRQERSHEHDIATPDSKRVEMMLPALRESPRAKKFDMKGSSWEHATVRIQKIAARELKPVEVGGKNDPYVEISFGDRWAAETSALDGAGSNATWRFAETNSEMQFEAFAVELETLVLKAVVSDKNATSSKTFIGEGSESVIGLTKVGLGETIEVTILLFDADQQPAGQVKFTLVATESGSRNKRVLPEIRGTPRSPRDGTLPLQGSSPRVLKEETPAVLTQVHCKEDEREEIVIVDERRGSIQLKVDEGKEIVIKAEDDEYGDEQYEDEFEEHEEEPMSAPTRADSVDDEKNALLAFEWTGVSPWSPSDPLSAFRGAICDASRLHVLELNLGRRGLCGAIPKAVSSFSSITVLSLFGNKMEGALPEELFSLVNLNRLNLYDNKFSGPLPAEFSNLTALETVNLSCNAFTGLIPMELALPALRELYLHQNILQGPIPMEFASRSLEEMTADMIPYSNFDKVGEWISSSQRLYWEEPVFEGAPHEGEKELLDALCEQYSEEVMQLSEGWTNWGFRSNEPLLMWRGVHLNKTGNIQSLVLRSCNMFGEIPTSVSKLERLVYLDMSLNSLEGDIPEQLATMKHLQFLHLDHNKLSGSLYILPSLKTLKTLDISHNAFDDEIPDNLKTLVGLESLRLNDNQITGCIPDTISALTRLRIMDASSNNLSGAIPSAVGKLRSLKYLNLSRNQRLEGTVPREFSRCINLEHLLLEDTSIDFKADDREDALKALQKLMPELKTIAI